MLPPRVPASGPPRTASWIKQRLVCDTPLRSTAVMTTCSRPTLSGAFFCRSQVVTQSERTSCPPGGTVTVQSWPSLVMPARASMYEMLRSTSRLPVLRIVMRTRSQ